MSEKPAAKTRRISGVRSSALALAGFLAACGGPATPDLTRDTGGGGTEFTDCNDLFTTYVQQPLQFCKTCHVPGGVADKPTGDKFMLSPNDAEDLANLRASWERVGAVEGVSRILVLAAGGEGHDGGTAWVAGSDIYDNVALLLASFEDPSVCEGGGSGGSGTTEPLLGSAHGGHLWFDFCEAHRGEAGWENLALPADPRSLVVKNGINTGKNVYFNAWWRDCHVDLKHGDKQDQDGADGIADLVAPEKAHPQTCGELVASAARGAIIMGAAPMEKSGGGFHLYDDGTIIRPGSTFAGDHPYGFGAIRAEQYNALWTTWGLPGRPENFDQLVAERYGFGPPSADHPYPLDGEDPNTTTPKGGTGRLPSGLIQTRLPDGSYSGEISTNCQGCHSTTINGQVVYGGGGSLLDAIVISRDYTFLGSAVGVAIDRLGLGGRVRGTNNAQFSNITALAGTFRDPEAFFDVMQNGSTGTGDTPAWWNVGRRPVKFVDAMLPGDAVRVDFALFAPLLVNKYGFVGPDGSFQSPAPDTAWTSKHVQDGDHYIMSRKAPIYPLPFDRALAETGAVLFHNKDLFAIAPNKTADKKGNGSCASCHGAYSPRYVKDPAFLADPALEGIASYVVPIDLIGTDRVRLDTYNEGTNQGNHNSSVGYPETHDQPAPYENCGVQNLPGLQTQADGSDRPKGYAAPPLYGVWATAPYFHNGSVPDVWGVLKSADRPTIWRRVSKPAAADQAGLVVMGFDTVLQTGYDAEKLGWKHDVLCAGDVPDSAECIRQAGDTQSQFILSEFYAGLLLGWNITNPPTLSNADVENRKIYNTTMFSQGNGGHMFTDVLTDPERAAIIEYLKTL